MGVIALVCLPLWHQISLGLILGFASSELYDRLLALRVDTILHQGGAVGLTLAGPFLSLVILGLPLVAAFMWPEHVSWVGVLAGLLVSKAALYATTFAGGRAGSAASGATSTAREVPDAD